jgi:type IV pilus assembly protein PilQ
LPIAPGKGPVTQIKGRILDDKEPVIARLEMLTAGDAAYTVERDVNDILISFKKEVVMVAAKAPVIAAQVKKAPVAEVQAEATSTETASQSVTPAIKVAAVKDEQIKETKEASGSQAVSLSDKKDEPLVAEKSPLADFGYAGYDKQSITVDFYKIDLHNVFRLFGEISGMNIIIAPGVGGTLTLSLDNVPWDFVLDVILNLKNLQALERHNTLIIAPSGAQFEWPERQEDALKVEKDKSIIVQESLRVSQKMEVTPEVLEAQKLMRQAREKERQEAYDEALDMYEMAFNKWPDNGKIANRLASMYLVHMGMNAKAVYYGKAALKIDGNDHDSALYTAIGLANMKKLDEAKEYFDVAVSGPRPASEALQSYAMFSEENGNYLEALLLLARHEDLYGDSIDTMIARARIYDKESNSDKAAAEYRAILLSGYQLPSDLARYIKGRLALEASKNKSEK